MRAARAHQQPPRAPATPPRARGLPERPRGSPGRPAGWSSRIVLPPPRIPLSAFYRHARLDAVAVLFYLFCPKIWRNPSRPKYCSRAAMQSTQRGYIGSTQTCCKQVESWAVMSGPGVSWWIPVGPWQAPAPR